MRRGTTAILTIKVADEDLSNATIYATLEQGEHQLTKDDATVSYANGTSTVTVTLTQKESLSFSAGAMKVQLAWIGSDGIAKRSTIETVSVADCLLNEEIAYAD